MNTLNSIKEIPFSFEVKDGIASSVLAPVGFFDDYKRTSEDKLTIIWTLTYTCKDTKLYINSIQVLNLKSLTISWNVNTVTVSGVIMQPQTVEEKLQEDIVTLKGAVKKLTLELFNERMKVKNVPSSHGTPFTLLSVPPFDNQKY